MTAPSDLPKKLFKRNFFIAIAVVAVLGVLYFGPLLNLYYSGQKNLVPSSEDIRSLVAKNYGNYLGSKTYEFTSEEKDPNGEQLFKFTSGDIERVVVVCQNSFRWFPSTGTAGGVGTTLPAGEWYLQINNSEELRRVTASYYQQRNI